jgi:hypothetical protein
VIMPIALQDVIVTLIAAIALLLVAWRLVQVAGPTEGKPACSNCSSCAPAAPVAAPTKDAGQPTPLIWVGRQKSRT